MWMAAMAPQALHTAPQTQSAPTRLEGKGRGGPVAARYIADVISDARSIAECIWVSLLLYRCEPAVAGGSLYVWNTSRRFHLWRGAGRYRASRQCDAHSRLRQCR